MKKELYFSNGKLKYWIEEFPVLEKVICKTESIKIERKDKKQAKYFCKQIAVEIYLYKHVGSYGLLGLEYIPNLSDYLYININVTTQNERYYKSDLTQYNEYRYLGLPEEYKEIIIEAVKNSAKIGGGILNIPIAANCEVGSSPHMFERITKLMLELMGNQEKIVNLQLQMQNMYQQYFCKNQK